MAWEIVEGSFKVGVSLFKISPKMSTEYRQLFALIRYNVSMQQTLGYPTLSIRQLV